MKFVYAILSGLAAFSSVASAADCPAAPPAGCTITSVPPKGHTKCNVGAYGVKHEGKVVLQECQVYGQGAEAQCASLCESMGKKCKTIRMRQNLTGPGSFCQLYGTAINKMGLVRHPGSSNNPDYYFSSTLCYKQTCAS